MNCVYSTRCLHCVFTNSFVLVAVICLLGDVNCAKRAVSRNEGGDRFTNPFYTNGINCTRMNAHCVHDLLKQCRECICNKNTETYRADIGKCVSTENLKKLTGCTYKGWKEIGSQLTDTSVPTLDFMESNSKDIHGENIFPGVDEHHITCTIANSTSFLNRYRRWVALPNISDALVLRVHGSGGPPLPRRLAMTWESVGDRYFGLLIKLQFFCQTITDPPINGCFVFKSKGSNPKLDTTNSPDGTRKKDPTVGTSKTSKPKNRSTAAPTRETTSTEMIVESNDNTFTVSVTVIIGVSAGVGLVIMIIIILAVCFVRHRTRKHKESTPSTNNTEAPPTVQFTAETRFSLIQPATPLDSEYEDYTSLQEKRESYDPYCPLEKDDVDLNVIDTILKDAVSMESMNPSSEPRYSCHLTKDNAIAIKSVKPCPPKQPKYFELEPPDNVNEPDYEEVDDEVDSKASSRLLLTKPPLPERECAERKPESQRLHSDC